MPPKSAYAVHPCGRQTPAGKTLRAKALRERQKPDNRADGKQKTGEMRRKEKKCLHLPQINILTLRNFISNLNVLRGGSQNESFDHTVLIDLIY